MNIKKNVSVGKDNIKASPLKHVAVSISDILTCIINLMLTTCAISNDLKLARVCPVYKGCNQNYASNYSPIFCILSVF